MASARLYALLLVLITLVLYGRVVHHEFIGYDDPAYVTENLQVQSGLTWDGLVWAFGQVHGKHTYWHPVTWISHMLDCQLFGLNAGIHHVINVLFHAANAVLLFFFLHRVSGSLSRSFVVAALFAWHPLQVDTVAWVTERKNVLSGLFWMLSLCAYARYAERPGLWRYALVLFGFSLGLMSKAAIVVFPCVLLLLDYWPLRRLTFGTPSNRRGIARQPAPSPRFQPATLPRLLVEKLPLFAVALASGIVTVLAHEQLGSLTVSEDLPLPLRCANALVSYVRYIGKTFWPSRLSIFYPHPGSWPEWQVVASGAVLLAITGVALWMLRRRPYLAVGWFWFLGVLVPAIGLVQAGMQAMADRFAYLAIIGLFLMLVWTIAEEAPRWKLGGKGAMLLAGGALTACLLVSERQLTFWKDGYTLWQHALAVTKNNAVAELNFGAELELRGQFEAALEHYREALRLRPEQPHVFNNLGNVLAELGHQEEALAQYQQALKLRPGVPLVHDNLAATLANLGRFDEAQSNYLTAIQCDPEDPRPRFLMGNFLLRRGKTAEAVEAFQGVLQLAPNHLQTLTQLAQLLASHEDPAIRNGTEAVQLARRAAALTEFQEPVVLATLATAYAEKGEYNEALKAARNALELAQAGGQSKLAEEIQTRLALFMAGRPFRESLTNGTLPVPGPTPTAARQQR